MFVPYNMFLNTYECNKKIISIVYSHVPSLFYNYVLRPMTIQINNYLYIFSFSYILNNVLRLFAKCLDNLRKTFVGSCNTSKESDDKNQNVLGDNPKIKSRVLPTNDYFDYWWKKQSESRAAYSPDQ